MFKNSGLLTFYAETSLHMGAGTSVSYVDLPIQRERHTEFPLMQATGIKGVIREFAERNWQDEAKVEVIFGPEDGEKFASCITFTDARILLFPVRSVSGIFAWITCPFVLKRFKRDLESAGITLSKFSIPEPSDENKIIIANNTLLKVLGTNQVMLEEFVFEIENEENIQGIAESIKNYLPATGAIADLINTLSSRLAVVSDNVFRDFVKIAVEINTRTRIDQTTGTVKEGALFSEELIPSESIFYSLVFFNDPYFGMKREVYDFIIAQKQNRKAWSKAQKTIEENENFKSEWKKLDNDIKDRIKKAYENDYLRSEDFYRLNQALFSNSSLLQLGGEETTGRGLVRVKFTPA
jgi:CRISPR-associated protein Cmr4